MKKYLSLLFVLIFAATLTVNASRVQQVIYDPVVKEQEAIYNTPSLAL